ncbi:MAG: glycosyltransferase family A protein [Rhizonema sp. NSF051]|nr:glycosyltransferase family A protein [Rhizonema sp. NSF051]
MYPLVSLIIPCYNSEKWVAETIQSGLAQTWKNKEVIIVDDGSKDNSLAVAKNFESSIVKVISQENQGAGAARNRALIEAQGDFIQYLDADDLLSPQKIEEQVLLLQQNPPNILAVCGTVHFFDGEQPSKGIFENGLPFLVDNDDPLNWLLRLLGADGRGGMVHPGAWLTPRSVANTVGQWDEQPSPDDDGEYFARIVLASAGIRRVNTSVSYYRKHKSSTNLSSANSERLQWGALRSIDLKTQHILAKTDTPRAKKALARCYMERAVIAYPSYPKVTEAALARIEELGGIDYLPCLGGWRIELLNKLFGWKFARKASVLYHQYIKIDESIISA